jgi:3-isopropylmalate/(R)-2-methylmalate dehydratase small subunit
MIFSGNIWRFGDHIDTDQILPAQYINVADPMERASHCFENICPDFVSKVQPGDIAVAGENFGCGSSRPSVEILQDLKLGGVVASSFGRIFFRGGIARGFPLIICRGINANDLPTGHRITVNIQSGKIVDGTAGRSFAAERYPSFLQQIIRAGGLMRYTRESFKKKEMV